jgi:hypothetical protein
MRPRGETKVHGSAYPGCPPGYLGVLMAPLLWAPVLAAAGPADPPIPAGRNPGGFPVAVIGDGFDYTQRPLAQMLARDGEGEIIGYDFIDDDRQPFGTGPDTDAAGIVIGEGQAATVVVIRADVRQIVSLTRAIGYATQSPASIIAILAPISTREVATVIAAAARKFPRHLFILEAGDDGLDLDAQSPAHIAPENVVVVTSADAQGALTPSANSGSSTVDLAVTTSGVWDRSNTTPAASPSKTAVARITALAARLRAVEPEVTVAELKSRIMALAAASPGKANTTRGGWIADPRRHFWLE